MRKLVTVIAIASACAAGSSPAHAFHDGGVAACEGCHTMHNSSGNLPMTKNARSVDTGNAFLLLGTDGSSTCLNCHSGASPLDTYRVATSPVPGSGLPPLQLTPGGDFAYLQKNYNWMDSGGQSHSSPGANHGHNISAADYLYFTTGARWTTAPGGSYPTSAMSCISCHDPHARYRILDSSGTIAATGKPIRQSGSYGAVPGTSDAVGVYRLLGGKNYHAAAVTSSQAFVNDPPVAVSPSVYNRSEDASDTRVAYGAGMSEWCTNCHSNLQHNSVNPSTTVGNHPSGYLAKLTSVYTTYDQYIYTGNLTNTDPNLGYNSLVPFEESITDLPTLTTDTTRTTGASSTDNVMCLTCHRAHASAWDSATRWNTTKAAYLTVDGSYPGVDAPTPTGQQGEYATGKTMAEHQQSMYGRAPSKFATNQWSLCNKCHENDQYKQ